MNKARRFFRRFFRSESGHNMVAYVLLVVLVAGIAYSMKEGYVPNFSNALGKVGDKMVTSVDTNWGAQE